MNILFDHDKLMLLTSNLYTLTGIRANIFDLGGSDLCLNTEGMPFCEKLQSCPGGYDRCVNCDRQAIAACGCSDEVYFYRCHAGICEAVLPILSDGKPLAYLLFGQFLDASPMEEQWQDTCSSIQWYPGPLDELRPAFDAFRQYSRQEISAYVEVLKALTSYIYLSGMIHSAEYTDLQRLDLYLDQHYTEKLSLASISHDLNIGRTKLCLLAKELSGGATLSHLLTQRRISAAKSLLLQSNLPISAVGDAVGISDYNYFSKVFRSATGVSPSEYRKTQRKHHPASGKDR